MKQFDLEEYQKNPNRKVITRDGRDVRILCTDRQGGDHPIIALCSTSSGIEIYFSYLHNWRQYVDTDSCNDLFFDIKKHEGWINLLRDSCGDAFVAIGSPWESEEVARSVISDKPNFILDESILIQNNFNPEIVSWWRPSEGDSFKIAIMNNDTSLCAKVKYVHELQHALRLCGLSELAKNLKI